MYIEYDLTTQWNLPYMPIFKFWGFFIYLFNYSESLASYVLQTDNNIILFELTANWQVTTIIIVKRDKPDLPHIEFPSPVRDWR